MSDSELQSDPLGDRSPLDRVRACSAVHASFSAVHGLTQVERLLERGSFRLRLPRGRGCEAVLINTGGGITGGDRLDMRLSLGDGADLIATSQAAEKLYRSDGTAARIAVMAHLGSASRLMWLPQESILFNGAIVERSLEVHMPANAHLTAVEVLTLGRAAHGELITDARWHDRWRIFRDGELVLAENVRLTGAISDLMKQSAIGDGARCIATLVHVAPDAEARIGEARAALAGVDCTSGLSTWDGILMARFAAAETHKLRSAVATTVSSLIREPMPRAWSC